MLPTPRRTRHVPVRPPTASWPRPGLALAGAVLASPAQRGRPGTTSPRCAASRTPGSSRTAACPAARTPAGCSSSTTTAAADRSSSRSSPGAGPRRCSTSRARLPRTGRTWRPGPATPCGSATSAGNRSEVNVVRVKRAARRCGAGRCGYASYRLRYPDGAHNAEAMMVRPGSGRSVRDHQGGQRGRHLPRTQDPRSPRCQPADPGRRRSRPGAQRCRLRTERASSSCCAATRRPSSTRSLRREPTQGALPEAHTFGEAVTFDRRGALIFGAEGVNEWLWRIT